MRSRTLRLGVVALLASLAALAGCSSDSPKPGHGRCTTLCTGRLDGAAYSILVPKDWNGTLLLYSHGYKVDTGTGPGHAYLSQSDTGGSGTDTVTRALLAKGYALAGSSYASAGWATKDAISAAERLHARFVKLVGTPKLVYAWGSSLGGLVSELLAEDEPWVDGAAPMCGAVAGPLLNFDNFLESIIATKALLYPSLVTSGLTTSSAGAQAGLLAKAIEQAAADPRGGAAKIMYIADLLGLPARSQYFSGTDATSRVDAAGQNLEGYVTFALAALAEATKRFGGNPARLPQNSPTTRLSAAQQSVITSLHGDPTAFADAVAGVPAPATVPAARAALDRSGSPTGGLRVPTMTLHTDYDPVAINQNETILSGRVAARHRLDRLIQLYVAPPATTPGKAGPPYGVGHCAFSTQQMVGLITTLDGWVRSGHVPVVSAVRTDLGPGFHRSFTPGPWPTGATR